MKRHVVLVGLSGSGKTEAGAVAARELGAPCIDIDAEIEAQVGKLITEIFAGHGESVFRTLEREAVTRALRGPAALVVPGGGWAAQPGNLDSVSKNVFTIYVRTTPDDAAARLSDTADRPLLVGDLGSSLTGQLAAREPFYERTDAVVDTTGLTAVQVGSKVAALARKSAGW